MHALVARRDNASARVRGAAFPGGDDASSADDDRHEGKYVVRLELRLDYQIDVARRQHAGDEGLRPVDGIEYPDVFRVGSFLTEFLSNNAMVRERAANEGAHRRLGGVVGGGDGVECARATLVLDAQRRAEEWQNGLARHGCELVHESGKVDRRHIAPLPRTANPLLCPIWHRGIAFKDWGALTFLVSTRSPAGRRKALPLHCGKATYAQQTVIPTRFPLAICALHCMLLRCGSAWRYRRPPWAFPP